MNLNRIIGLGINEPATESTIDEICALYDASGVRYAFVVSPAAQPAEIKLWLRAKRIRKGFVSAILYPAVLERYRGLPSATARAGRLVGAAPRHPEVHLLAGANVTHQVNAKGADAEARRRGPLDREKRGPVTFGVWCLQYAAQTCSQRSLTLSPGSPAIWRNSPP